MSALNECQGGRTLVWVAPPADSRHRRERSLQEPWGCPVATAKSPDPLPSRPTALPVQTHEKSTGSESLDRMRIGCEVYRHQGAVTLNEVWICHFLDSAHASFVNRSTGRRMLTGSG